MTESIEVRLTKLERAEQARTALAQYVRAMDARDVDTLATHFAVDIEFRGADGVVRHGRPAVVEFFGELFRSPGPTPRHVLTNIDVDTSDPLRVIVRSAFALIVLNNPVLLGTGTYRDELVWNGEVLQCAAKYIALDGTALLSVDPASG